MHQTVRNFVERFKTNDKTLEIGSLNVNGTIKEWFGDYTGVDMRGGDNVDVVMNGNKLTFPNELFSCVLNLETFEHDQYFWKTMEEMKRVLIPGGRLVLTTRGINFRYHPHPRDYFRFTPDYFEDLEGFENKIIEIDPEGGVFFSGTKTL